jgi:hypothetical protein
VPAASSRRLIANPERCDVEQAVLAETLVEHRLAVRGPPPQLGAVLGCARFPRSDIVNDMKTISVTVSEGDYERFREAAEEEDRPIAQLIREAMALYREDRLDRRQPLREVPVLVGRRVLKRLPSRTEIYDEAFE